VFVSASPSIGSRGDRGRDRPPNIGGILLDIDSPGGAVAGATELAELVRELSQQKGIAAFVNGYATSAAYAIASGANPLQNV
jgi:capsid assembly protease